MNGYCVDGARRKTGECVLEASGFETCCEDNDKCGLWKETEETEEKVNITKEKQTITKKTWVEFKDTGLLWWVNRILHLYGWVIVFDYHDEDPTALVDVYPARTIWRGFPNRQEVSGFKKLSKYLKENIDELEKETYL